jgi:hypothetical protein
MCSKLGGNNVGVNGGGGGTRPYLPETLPALYELGVVYPGSVAAYESASVLADSESNRLGMRVGGTKTFLAREKSAAFDAGITCSGVRCETKANPSKSETDFASSIFAVGGEMCAFATNCFRPGGVTGLNLENRHRLSYFSHN